jgi:hypothetical protein
MGRWPLFGASDVLGGAAGALVLGGGVLGFGVFAGWMLPVEHPIPAPVHAPAVTIAAVTLAVLLICSPSFP